jgi:tetratricopeptide (TPR) repeat protein
LRSCAVEQFRSVLEMEPNFARAHILASAYAEQGKYVEALAEVGTWKRIEYGPWVEAQEAYVNGRAGNAAAARESYNRLLALAKTGHAGPLQLCVGAIGTGEKEKAIEYLWQSYEDRSINTAIKVDPIYDPLRGDARFEEILRGMGLKK